MTGVARTGRRDVEQPSTPVHKDMSPPENRKEPEMKKQERTQPEPVRSNQGREPQDPSHEKQTTMPEPQKQAKDSANQTVRNQPDKVKIRTSPVAGKPDKGLLRKNNPAQPAQEQNTLKEKGKKDQGQRDNKDKIDQDKKNKDENKTEEKDRGRP